MQKLPVLTFFFSKNISQYAVFFYDQNFNDMITNNINSFEQLGPGLLCIHAKKKKKKKKDHFISCITYHLIYTQNNDFFPIYRYKIYIHVSQQNRCYGYSLEGSALLRHFL